MSGRLARCAASLGLLGLLRSLGALGSLASLASLALASCASDPLPSWSEGPARDAVLRFVSDATTEGSPRFVPRAERIAVFDNDGTLWSEQPFYFQLAFTLDRVRALAPSRPEWREQEPFRSVLAGDLQTALAGGEAALLALVLATHAGLTPEELREAARAWLAVARHPTLGRRYLDLVFQPMLELLAYLRSAGFATYIVSGGGAEFVRAFAEERYGIPPEQVIGSQLALRYEASDAGPRIVQEGKVAFLDDKEGKPLGIARHIGRRPVAAFGNSDGDLAMLEWTAAGAGPRFCLLVHHTDGAREFAYDRDSEVGKLDRALERARERGWTVVDMRRDWRRVFP